MFNHVRAYLQVQDSYTTDSEQSFTSDATYQSETVRHLGSIRKEEEDFIFVCTYVGLLCVVVVAYPCVFTCVSYAEACNSYTLDVRPSVRPSVCLSVCPSVRRWYCI